VGLNKITQSKNYFLLWGPPGTGKTSVLLRDLAAWVLNETSDNLLLLAYTNRAVDEICEALDSIGFIRHSLGEGRSNIRGQYLRIGGKHSTAERFRDQLLNTKIASAKNRADLRAVLESHRIFVSTVASFGQNEGLLKLKKFQRLIVDEASQILEPQLIGLLTRFEHFTLIGDHRQLPAVTTQQPETTVVQDADLNSIGLNDLRDSYFERLYRRCMQQGWHWAYGQLDRQGRMHTDIMEFPNRHFYGDRLQTLTQENGHYQCLPLRYNLPLEDALFGKVFAEKRVVFLPAAPEENLPNQKTNRTEAELAVRLVRMFKHLWETNGKPWHPAKTLGIITPWRAQIAQLRESLAAAGLDPDELTIDTVERYQGGAREIIIISTCVNTEYQLASLVNLSGEGVDRKMNVALTRAREHLIMLGNEEILQKDERYRAFIEQYIVSMSYY
jgi:DNA replication ATP-dependent helicase Dna2